MSDNKIWVVKTTTTFTTSYIVAAEERPDDQSVLGMIKDGYIPEFKQEYGGETILDMTVVPIEEYYDMWEVEATEQEKKDFITQLGAIPQVPDDDVDHIMIPES